MTLVDTMYRYAENRPKKVITRISPSMLGRCMRAHYFAIHGVEQTTPPNPGAILNFQVGFLWETVLRDALRDSDTPFIEQFHMEDEELNVEGTLDFATYDPKQGTWTVIDSKTESAKATGYRKHEGKGFFESHPEYVVQLTAYQIMLERQGFKVPEGKFVVITKDNGFVEESLVSFNQKLKDKVLERIDRLNSYLQDEELPPCSCEGWQVNYCGWGTVDTIAKNSTGKMVPFECCDEDLLNVKEAK